MSSGEEVVALLVTCLCWQWCLGNHGGQDSEVTMSWLYRKFGISIPDLCSLLWSHTWGEASWGRGGGSRSRGGRGGGGRRRGCWSHCCKVSEEAKEMDTEIRSLSPFYSVQTQAHEVYKLPFRNVQRFDSQVIFRSCLVIVNIKSPEDFGLMYTPTWLPGYPEDKGERKGFSWSFSLLGNGILQIPPSPFCTSGEKFPGRRV